MIFYTSCLPEIIAIDLLLLYLAVGCMAVMGNLLFLCRDESARCDTEWRLSACSKIMLSVDSKWRACSPKERRPSLTCTLINTARPTVPLSECHPFSCQFRQVQQCLLTVGQRGCILTGRRLGVPVTSSLALWLSRVQYGCICRRL